MSSHQDRWGFPAGFYCEHIGSESRVLARVIYPDVPDVLVPVVSVPDPVLAHRVADLLSRVADVGAAAAMRLEAQTLAGDLPQTQTASFHESLDWAAAGRWPLSEVAAAVVDKLDGSDVTQVDDGPSEPTVEDGMAEDEIVEDEIVEDEEGEGLVVEVDRTLRLRILDPDRVLAAAQADGWRPAPAEDLDDSDPDDLLGAVMWLTGNVRFLPGVQILDDDAEGQLIAEADELADEDPDFAALFPVDEPTPAAGDADADEGWRLTPRTADALYSALSALADQAYDDVEVHNGAVVDADDESWTVFHRLPRVTFHQDADWRRQVARAADDLRGDVEAGQWPQPRCTAEEVCLYLAITDAEAYEDLHQDSGLPLHDDDYDWGSCLEVLFDGTDFLMYYDPRFDGFEDPQAEINKVFGGGDMRPANWFTPFGHRDARDPDRGFRH